MADLTLTQEELDQRISAAVSAAEERTRSQFANYDELKTAAERLQELERSNEDAVQRQIREAKEAAQAELPTLVSQATTSAKQSVVESEIRAWAAQYNFSYPDDVVAKLRDSDKIKVSDKFKVSGVEDLVKDLATARPEWLKRNFNGAPPRGSNGNAPDLTTEERQTYIQNVMRERRATIGAAF